MLKANESVNDQANICPLENEKELDCLMTKVVRRIERQFASPAKYKIYPQRLDVFVQGCPVTYSETLSTLSQVLSVREETHQRVNCLADLIIEFFIMEMQKQSYQLENVIEKFMMAK